MKVQPSNLIKAGDWCVRCSSQTSPRYPNFASIENVSLIGVGRLSIDLGPEWHQGWTKGDGRKHKTFLRRSARLIDCRCFEAWLYAEVTLNWQKRFRDGRWRSAAGLVSRRHQKHRVSHSNLRWSPAITLPLETRSVIKDVTGAGM